MTSEPRRRTPSEVRAIQEHLQLLADSPQLRRRFGYARLTAALPFSDSRRPTDSRPGFQIDYRSYRCDAERNYAAGLL